jgi:hypothetical protein
MTTRSDQSRSHCCQQPQHQQQQSVRYKARPRQQLQASDVVAHELLQQELSAPGEAVAEAVGMLLFTLVEDASTT